MAIQKVYSLYDSKAEAYIVPTFMALNNALALRMMQDTLRRDENLHNHAADFTLFHLADFDTNKGVFINNEAKTNLGNLLELVPTNDKS